MTIEPTMEYDPKQAVPTMEYDNKVDVDHISLEEDKQRNPQASKHFSVSFGPGASPLLLILVCTRQRR